MAMECFDMELLLIELHSNEEGSLSVVILHSDVSLDKCCLTVYWKSVQKLEEILINRLRVFVWLN